MNYKRITFGFCSIILLYSTNCFAQNTQTSDLGSWNIISLKKTYANNFFSYAETQTRSQKIFDKFYYYELKAGAGYNFSKDFNAFVGLGKYETYQYDGNFKTPVQSSETRLWEQFALTSRVNRIVLEHRYRIEQRWINDAFYARFRMRLNAIIPINHYKLVAKTWYASVYDEVFFTNQQPFFQRNRILLGGGYQFNDKVALQSCWIRQYDYAPNGTSVGKSFIQTSLLFTLPARKRVPVIEKHPSTDD
jgi:Protein of unknown function (DUF2490).